MRNTPWSCSSARSIVKTSTLLSSGLAVSHRRFHPRRRLREARRSFQPHSTRPPSMRECGCRTVPGEIQVCGLPPRTRLSMSMKWIQARHRALDVDRVANAQPGGAFDVERQRARRHVGIGDGDGVCSWPPSGNPVLPRGRRTVDQWFDPSVFAPPALAQQVTDMAGVQAVLARGNAGRRIARGPGLNQSSMGSVRSATEPGLRQGHQRTRSPYRAARDPIEVLIGRREFG
jgi:hypothetical protein